MPRPRRAAAAANVYAPEPVPTVEEDPLAADDADEVSPDDEESSVEPQPLNDDSEAESGSESGEPVQVGDVVEEAELETEEEPYKELPSDSELADADDLVRSPLQTENAAATGTKKRGQAGPDQATGSAEPVQLPPSAAAPEAAPAAAPKKKQAKKAKIAQVHRIRACGPRTQHTPRDPSPHIPLLIGFG